jgi:hypothetical protein
MGSVLYIGGQTKTFKDVLVWQKLFTLEKNSVRTLSARANVEESGFELEM